MDASRARRGWVLRWCDLIARRALCLIVGNIVSMLSCGQLVGMLVVVSVLESVRS